ncbi:DUF4861 family protein [Rubellicoccus peritrichatus]|uniref:DUF4861 family protein n=1 Tax=Rubellicoccus peritrichatus TaxID=3080537 RepID=A0AAQ3L7T8_9BACT|nr:DUF4861 family protein [Puniceicoccus sp. CR14]WOO40850.1 DUF4861 family protein [Puniceicoccus sp. CR14]
MSAIKFIITVTVFSLAFGCQSVADDAATSVADAETYARFVPERKDDFAWENDLIAFRAYGPASRDGAENAGIDCWLKRVPYPIINKWYDESINQGKSYHTDHGEGLDNYHTGASAGCGGTAIWLDGQREPLETFTEWEILKSSPERTVFALTYENEIDGDVYKEVKEITIELGQRLFKANSTFWKNGEPAAGLPIAIGLATHDGKASVSYDQSEGWAACWEILDGSGLGTGVIVNPDEVSEIVVIEPTGKDTGHVAIIAETDSEGQITYYAGYGWEKAGAIKTSAAWENYLKTFL